MPHLWAHAVNSAASIDARHVLALKEINRKDFRRLRVLKLNLQDILVENLIIFLRLFGHLLLSLFPFLFYLGLLRKQ